MKIIFAFGMSAFVALISLYPNFGLASSQLDSAKTMWDVPLSSLVLTHHQLKSLKPEERAEYFVFLLSMLQITELSQQVYDSASAGKSNETGHNNAVDSTESLRQAVLRMMISDAEALPPLIVMAGAARAAPYVMRAATAVRNYAGNIAMRGITYADEAAAVRTAAQAATIAGTQQRAVALNHARDFVLAQSRANAGAATAAERQLLQSELVRAKRRADLSFTEFASTVPGGITQAARKAFQDEAAELAVKGATASGSRLSMTSARQSLSRVVSSPITNTVVSGGAGYLAGQAGSGGNQAPDAGGGSPQVANAAAVAEASVGAEGAGAPLVTDPSSSSGSGGGQAVGLDLNSMVGQGCVFGLRPSRWKQLSPGRITCERPAAGQDANCKDQQFLCPRIGLEAALATNSLMCISLDPRRDLSVRCANAVTGILTTQPELRVDADQLGQFRNLPLGNAGQTLDAYCSRPRTTLQLGECEAMSALLRGLSTRTSVAVVAAAAGGTATPGAPAPISPAGATAPAAR